MSVEFKLGLSMLGMIFSFLFLRFYAQELEADKLHEHALLYAEFEMLCSEIGVVDQQEDACRLSRDSRRRACKQLIVEERKLRDRISRLLKDRNRLWESVSAWEKFVLLQPERWFCSERSDGGLAYKKFL